MRNPSRDNQTQTQTKHRPDQRARGGVGRGRQDWKPDDQDGMLPWSERRADLFRWAESHLPDQHPALVVVAIIAIRMGGEKPTKEKVLARLKATGREASQIGYGDGGYAA